MTRSAPFPRGHLTMPGDICGCHKWGRRSYGYLVGREANDAVKRPTMQPTTKIYVTQNVNTADAEKLGHRVSDKGMAARSFHMCLFGGCCRRLLINLKTIMYERKNYKVHRLSFFFF